MKDYTGKTIFLGIDVHKQTYAVAALYEGTVMKKASMIADPEKLVAFCQKFFPGASIESAYEAGFSGFHLHRILEKNGIKNLVVHAASIEVAVGDRVKTDKRDALKIATQLEAKRLKGIYVPSEAREAKRAISRIRNTLVEHRTTVANQIKALLHQHGLLGPSDYQKISAKWIKRLETLPMSTELQYALNQLIILWKQLTIQIKDTDAKMKKQAVEDHPLEHIYRSVPGIGPVAARVLANELEDMSQFANERQLFSYTGLTPSEYSSGGHIRKGHISRQGKPLIRKILVQAAWKAIQKNPQLREAFDRISVKAGCKRAIIAIARRLLGHIRACFKNQCLYTKAQNSVATAA